MNWNEITIEALREQRSDLVEQIVSGASADLRALLAEKAVEVEALTERIASMPEDTQIEALQEKIVACETDLALALAVSPLARRTFDALKAQGVSVEDAPSQAEAFRAKIINGIVPATQGSHRDNRSATPDLGDDDYGSDEVPPGLMESAQQFRRTLASLSGTLV